MGKEKLPYKIKPVVMKQRLYLIAIFIIMILLVPLLAGEINLSVFIILLIIMMFLFYTSLKRTLRIIIVDKEKCEYKGLTTDEIIYKDINYINIIERRKLGIKTYSMIMDGIETVELVNIMLYDRRDIDLLLEVICEQNKKLHKSLNVLRASMNKVQWRKNS